MNIARRSISLLASPARFSIWSAVLAGAAFGLPLDAQQLEPQVVTPIPAVSQPAMLIASSTLPDAPGFPSASETSSSSAEDSAAVDFGAQAHPAEVMASPTDKYIHPGQQAPSLTIGNKFLLGVKDAVSPLSFVGWVVTAGYEQATNGSPNYGTNATAFAQRFGAAAARASSEGIFSDSIMASVLHEDPRYYRMGPGNSFLKRTAYAVTRTLVTRTDGGHTTPNFALLAGNLGGSYLTKTYYPALNQTNTEVLKTFGGSIGGSALGFFVSEFLSGTLNIFHGSKPAGN